MKKIFLLTLLSMNMVWAIGGFGLHVPLDRVSVSEETEAGAISFTRGALENPFGFGGYVFIDAIPFIDLEVDFQAAAMDYDLSYSAGGFSISEPFAWSRGSTYFTVKKKLFGLGIPFLANAKLHAGGGYNKHVTTPFASPDMIADVITSLGATTDSAKLVEGLKDYLVENKLDASGFHAQAGLQFKLLMLDTHFFYRYTIAKDVYKDASGFGSFNIRLGMVF